VFLLYTLCDASLVFNELNLLNQKIKNKVNFLYFLFFFKLILLIKVWTSGRIGSKTFLGSMVWSHQCKDGQTIIEILTMSSRKETSLSSRQSRGRIFFFDKSKYVIKAQKGRNP
jgi:hypothetical protein